MLDPLVANIIRFVVVVLLVLCVGGTGKVFQLYQRATRLAPRTAGLLPWHVVAVSAGVLLLQIGLAWGLLAQVGQSLTMDALGRFVLYGLGSVLILASLWIVGGLQHRRVNFVDQPAQVTVQKGQEIRVDDGGSPG